MTETETETSTETSTGGEMTTDLTETEEIGIEIEGQNYGVTEMMQTTREKMTRTKKKNPLQ